MEKSALAFPGGGAGFLRPPSGRGPVADGFPFPQASFSREDRIAIIFCGSKKSLATGIPMMNVIFAGAPIGLLVIPIMVFHQLQLMVCSFLARKWAKDVGKGEQL